MKGKSIRKLIVAAFSLLKIVVVVLLFPKRAAEVINKLDKCVSDAEFIRLVLEIEK